MADNKNTEDKFKARLLAEGYNVGSYSYPDGLGVNPDLQHYVTFFINVRGKSKFVKDRSYGINDNPAAAPSPIAGISIRNNLDNGGIGTAATFGGAAALGIGIAFKGATGALLSEAAGGNKAPNAAGAAAAAAGRTPAARIGGAVAKTIIAGLAATAGGAALAKTTILKTDKTHRLKDVITLHMQERPAVSYGINYQDKDLGILGGLLGVDSAISSTLDEGGLTPLMARLAIQAANIPSMLPGFGNIADIVQLGAKVKTNPFREVFFEGIDYRKFNFRYKFMPKSFSEVKAIKDIIDKFKEHMHPEVAGGGYFFLYPSEFEIAYYYNNKENRYFNKIATCALTDMSVEYGGEQFSTFSDGAPTEINLTLSFRELELITKESIKSRGY